jgi:hypothetical protein
MEVPSFKPEMLITVSHGTSTKMSKRFEGGLLVVAQNEWYLKRRGVRIDSEFSSKGSLSKEVSHVMLSYKGRPSLE